MHSFSDVARIFRDGAGGTDDYKVLSKACFALMKTEPENAAGYFVLSIASRSYVTHYEDQGVEAKVADAAKTFLTGLLEDMERALALPPEQRLQLFGAIANRYEFDIHNF